MDTALRKLDQVLNAAAAYRDAPGLPAPVYNIKAYGAKGNGTTNDGKAVQDAWDDAPDGAVVWVPDDTFGIGTAIALTGTRKRLAGPGTLKALSALGSAGNIITLGGTENEISGVKLDQNNLTTGRSIRVLSCTRGAIRSVRSTNVQQAFVYIDDSVTDLWVVGCQHDTKGYAILADDPSGLLGLYAIGNHFEFTSGSGIGDGIEINCPTSGASRAVIAHNYIRGFIGDASNAGIGIGLARVSHALVAANYVLSCESDFIHLENDCDHGLVIGNTVRDNVGSAVNNGNGIAIITSRQCQVIGNNAHNIRRHGIMVRGSDAGVQEFHNQVIGNNLRILQRAGIFLHAQNEFVCQGNAIIGASQATSATYAGIHVEQILSAGTTQDGTIANNLVRDSGFATLAGIWTHSSAARLEIASNRLANTATPINVNAVANHAQHDNWFSTGARMGSAALVNGTVTVSTAEVRTGDRIRLTRIVGTGTTRGILSVGTITNATSFVINSTDLAGTLSADDDSTIFWEIVH